MQKTEAYPWICRGFLRTLDPQEIGADQDKNRSVQVIAIFGSTCILYRESASSVFGVICIVKEWHILYMFSCRALLNVLSLFIKRRSLSELCRSFQADEQGV